MLMAFLHLSCTSVYGIDWFSLFHLILLTQLLLVNINGLVCCTVKLSDILLVNG